ncbi:MAG: type II secretion system F family protein [Beijerinckiaceae bacterium]|nr:type II secretion system F family protein [Beijerinckiaceae bacterium]
MFGVITDFLLDPQSLFRLIIAVAAAAAIFTVAAPIFDTDPLAQRMKAVADERARIRLRERERLNSDRSKLREQGYNSYKRLVARFSLTRWVGAEEDKMRLSQAGYRREGALYAFLVARAVCPMAMFLFGGLYLFFVLPEDYALTTKIGAVITVGYIGFKLPDIWLKNQVSKRQTSIRAAFPDALDLLLICVESGMPIEQAFKRVSEEIGVQSVPLAEELAVTTAELSYLPNRRTPYENLGKRTGLEDVRNITTVLIQAESYGTPIGTALRVVSQESRDTRMMLAEKKAAALPPKLTVPMILFFLPVLFAVILTPAFIQMGKTNL